jgi:hypothetical protein
MQNQEINSLRPFISVLVIITTLFGLVILQMEERRMGYELLKLNHDFHSLVEQRRDKDMNYAKITRPQYVERAAQSRLSLRKLQANQIIHLTGASRGNN